jgi:uncharacterized membrane protein (UPF0127 family)
VTRAHCSAGESDDWGIPIHYRSNDNPLVEAVDRSAGIEEIMASRSSAVVNDRTGAIVGSAIVEADGPWRSFKGLMHRKSLPDGHGIVFRPVRGIHTQFMRFPIDLIFLDKSNLVVKVRPAMGAWRFDFTNADAVIEMNAGAAAANDVRVGDRLLFQPV